MTFRFLTEAGCKLTAAANNQEAVSAMNAERPDLIILNLILRNSGSGFELIEHVKADEKTKNIPLILIAQQDLNQEEINRLNGGIRTILNKGLLTQSDLLGELKEIIGKM